MNTHTSTASIYDFDGVYGQEWTQGILVDRVEAALAAGLRLHTMPASGRQYLTGPQGGEASPVLCGDLVEVWTEDGRIDGRCGLPALAGRGACAGHADQRDAWLAQTEAEVMEWERQNDRI